MQWGARAGGPGEAWIHKRWASFGAFMGSRRNSCSISTGNAPRVGFRAETGDRGGKRDLDTFLFVQKYVLLRRGVLSSTFLGLPREDLDPSLPSEIDEPLDEMRLLELFEECGPAT